MAAIKLQNEQFGVGNQNFGQTSKNLLPGKNRKSTNSSKVMRDNELLEEDGPGMDMTDLKSTKDFARIFANNEKTSKKQNWTEISKYSYILTEKREPSEPNFARSRWSCNIKNAF